MKFNITALLCTLLLALGFSFAITAGPIIDSDSDGIINQLDNCQTVANPDQYDSDCDGYGALCDADCDGDFNSFGSDFALMGGPTNWNKLTTINTPSGTADPCLDLDNDGNVFGSDFAILGGPNVWNQLVGPSGYDCAGTGAPCASTAVAQSCH